MKRSEKILMGGAAIALAGICVFAAFVGVTNQKRQAARAQLSKPASLDLYEALQSTDDMPNPAAARGNSPGNTAELTPMHVRIHSFEELFTQFAFVHNDPMWGDVVDTLDEPRAAWPPDMHDRLYALVDMLQTPFAQARALARQGGPVFPLDMTQGYAMPLPHLGPLRHLAQLFGADAMVAGERGQTERVVDDIIAILQLGEAIAPEPVLASQWARISISEHAFNAMQCLPEEDLNDTFHERLDERLAGAGHRKEFKEAFSGEALLMRNMFDSEDLSNSYQWEPSSGVVRTGAARLYGSPLGTPLVQLDEAEALDITADAQRLIDMPYLKAHAAALNLRARIENLPPIRLLSRMIIPDAASMLDMQTKHEVMLDLARIGLAVEAFRRDLAEYPAALSDLAENFPEGLPQDPFSGKDYVYRAKPEGFTLYSIGRNQIDDGGRHDPYNLDIVWRKPRESRK